MDASHYIMSIFTQTSGPGQVVTCKMFWFYTSYSLQFMLAKTCVTTLYKHLNNTIVPFLKAMKLPYNSRFSLWQLTPYTQHLLNELYIYQQSNDRDVSSYVIISINEINKSLLYIQTLNENFLRTFLHDLMMQNSLQTRYKVTCECVNVTIMSECDFSNTETDVPNEGVVCFLCYCQL